MKKPGSWMFQANYLFCRLLVRTLPRLPVQGGLDYRISACLPGINHVTLVMVMLPLTGFYQTRYKQ